MRPTVRRIDLTQTPTVVEVWPSLDWLEPTGGPHGRSGLWDAMASAVQRARESSRGESFVGDDEVLAMADTPHLAYLARVACSTGTGREDLPGADVIALVDARTADAG